MKQEDFFKKLVDGEVPSPFDVEYNNKFLQVCQGDHLLVLFFGCKCLRFIEVKVRYTGLMRAGLAVPSNNREYSWSYIYPETQIGCGALIVDHDWERRNLPAFQMRVGYHHGYFDWAFREHRKKLDRMPTPIPLVNQDLIV